MLWETTFGWKNQVPCPHGIPLRHARLAQHMAIGHCNALLNSGVIAGRQSVLMKLWTCHNEGARQTKKRSHLQHYGSISEKPAPDAMLGSERRDAQNGNKTWCALSLFCEMCIEETNKIERRGGGWNEATFQLENGQSKIILVYRWRIIRKIWTHIHCRVKQQPLQKVGYTKCIDKSVLCYLQW